MQEVSNIEDMDDVGKKMIYEEIHNENNDFYDC